MARKQVLVQLDDHLVEQLDALAARLEVSRSELIRVAASALLQAEEWAEADRQAAEAYRRQPPDLDLIQASTKLAAEMADEW